MPGLKGSTPKILISISTTNPTYILHTMPEDIQERMRALIAHHGSALAALVAFRQQPKAQQNVVYIEVLEMYFGVVIL
jgi:hypothetical protein